MEVRHLQTFRAVLREGSFHTAARTLRLAQPTVTLHVQELEAEFGLPLFDRRGSRRRLTPAGEIVAERALPILDALDALARSLAELRDGSAGFLRIGAIEPAASRRVTPLLARLRRRRPGLRVQLDVGGTAGVSRAVADGDVDLGLCSAPPVELGLVFEPLYEEEMVLLVPLGHRLASRGALVAQDLDHEPLLLTEQGCAYRRAVESALQEHGVAPLWALESGSTATLREAVRHNLGIAVLPRWAALPPPPGTVVRRLSDVSLALPVGLVTRSGGAPPPPALAALVADLRRGVTRRPPSRARG
ncbi:MAG TPA: LysR family transcriptional regulator [Thermoanaerobaculia bacterium]|nr:LysR family transcriptional regulator [Thermoanaerobaculia bacterium]